MTDIERKIDRYIGENILSTIGDIGKMPGEWGKD